VCPVVLSVVALVLAGSADTAIDASSGALGGRGLVTAARIIAWAELVAVGLLAVFGVSVLVGLALGAT
ncbi:MAG: hypothetical protein WAN48_13400, partial [Actinomycetes bacterium]